MNVPAATDTFMPALQAPAGRVARRVLAAAGIPVLRVK